MQDDSGGTSTSCLAIKDKQGLILPQQCRRLSTSCRISAFTQRSPRRINDRHSCGRERWLRAIHGPTAAAHSWQMAVYSARKRVEYEGQPFFKRARAHARTRRRTQTYTRTNTFSLSLSLETISRRCGESAFEENTQERNKRKNNNNNYYYKTKKRSSIHNHSLDKPNTITRQTQNSLKMSKQDSPNASHTPVLPSFPAFHLHLNPQTFVTRKGGEETRQMHSDTKAKRVKAG